MGPQFGFSTRSLNRSMLARPYIWRFRNFRRLTWPSVCPLLQFSLNAARTAGKSARKLRAKLFISGASHRDRRLSHRSNSFGRRRCMMPRNCRDRVRTSATGSILHSACKNRSWSLFFGSPTPSFLQPAIHANARRADGHGKVRTSGGTPVGLPCGMSSRTTQCCTAARLPV